MSLRCRGAGLFTPNALAFQRGAHRVVIPRLPMQDDPASSDNSGHRGGRVQHEYHANKHIPPHTTQFLDREGADSLRRQEQLRRFHEGTEAAVEKVWRDSKPHLRKQQTLIEEFGVEGAVRETLDPSRTGFHQQLRARPLDRAILEEIYLGLHGKRVERRLKKGVSWEHWITKGDGTAPVYTTSRKGQQTFAFGGNVRQVSKATHPSQFPVVMVPGKEAAAAASASTSERESRSPHDSLHRKRHHKRASRADGGRRGLVDRELLVPEVAFIGRTSSGKSALINAIVNATIAPYGHLQGTTSAVHFYSIANKVMLVDCPGYGYYNPLETPGLDAENAVKAMRAYLRAGARRRPKEKKKATHASENDSQHGTEGGAAAAVSDREKQPGNNLWGVEGVDSTEDDAAATTQTAKSIVQPRNIKRVFLCVPARGMQHTDLAYCRVLEELGIPFSVVLTKTDASPIRMLARLADYTRCQLVQFTQCKELMLASSLRLAGIDKMQSLIGSMAVVEDRMAGATLDFSSIV